MRVLFCVLYCVLLAYSAAATPPPPSPSPPPPGTSSYGGDPYGCNSAWCTSPDGQGGTECYAGPYGEPCSCSQGGARPVGTTPYAGQTYTQYTCCTDDSGLPTQGSSCDYTTGVVVGTVPPAGEAQNVPLVAAKSEV